MRHRTATEKTVIMKQYRHCKQTGEPLAKIVKKHGFKDSSTLLCHIGRWSRSAGFLSAKDFGASTKPFYIEKDRFEKIDDDSKTFVPVRLYCLPWTIDGLKGIGNASV